MSRRTRVAAPLDPMTAPIEALLKVASQSGVTFRISGAQIEVTVKRG